MGMNFLRSEWHDDQPISSQRRGRLRDERETLEPWEIRNCFGDDIRVCIMHMRVWLGEWVP